MSLTDLPIESIKSNHSFTDLLNYKISIKFIIFTLSIFCIFLCIVVVLLKDDIKLFKEYQHSKKERINQTTTSFDDKNN
jgi:hypothetical protein